MGIEKPYLEREIGQFRKSLMEGRNKKPGTQPGLR